MTNYEFVGSLYKTRIDMLDAIADRWITSNSRATLEDVRDILLNASDAELAADCMTEWQLNWLDAWPDEPVPPTHMERFGYDATDLASAMGRFREDIEHDLDVEAKGGWESYEP